MEVGDFATNPVPKENKMRIKKKKINFADDWNLMFWLPPSDTSTHVAIQWSKSGNIEIYIDGYLQDKKALQELGEWKGSLMVAPKGEQE